MSTLGIVPSERPLIDALEANTFEEALFALNVSGLAEPHLYIKRFNELSNGQRYRAMTARLIASGSEVWVADEFCATLDAVTSNIVSRNLRRCAKALGVTVILAAANWSAFIDELRDILWAEEHLLKTLPKMRDAATSEQLQAAFEEHTTVTATHVKRLERAFELLGVKASGKKCEAIKGITDEGETIIDETEEGTATRDVYLCLVRTDAAAKNFKEALTNEVTVGATAAGASTHDFPVMLDNILGAKLKVISGYKGSHEIMLAVEKNEVQGACGISWPTVATHFSSWIDKKFAMPMVQEGVSGHPAMNKLGTPLAIDFAKKPDDRKILELVYSQLIFGRPYVLAPETPPERVAALRKAFMVTLQDKRLLADAAKMGVDIDPVPGEELQNLIAKIYSTPPDLVARAKAALVQKK